MGVKGRLAEHGVLPNDRCPDRYYSMWLGPIAAVMVMDYWVFRKRHLRPEELYNHGGVYSYYKGVGVAGLVSFALGLLSEYIISGLQGTIKVYFGFIPVPGVELAWYYGFLAAAISYLVIGLASREKILPELRLGGK